MKYFIYRLILPVINLKAFSQSIANIFRYPVFLLDYFKYVKHSKDEVISFLDLYPCLSDKTSVSQTGKGHYFYQDIWALGKVFRHLPIKHIDVGSRIDGFAGQCSAFCQVEFVDLRAVGLGLENFNMKEGNILNMPYPDSSVDSLSSLHVVEHIGLGRYGDDIDSEGSKKAMIELQRILKVGGNLYFGIPIGTERVMYNAHRIHNPNTIIKFFNKCDLVEFSVIDDNGVYIKNADYSAYVNSKYACGLFHFRKSQK